MNELDFIEALSEKSKRKEAAQEFLGHLKQAGLAEIASQFVQNHSSEIGAALAGGVLATGAQYLANRPKKDGVSGQQAAARHMETKQKLLEQQAKLDGRELSFREELQSATTPAVSRVADVLAKHPGKGALMAAPAGALAGLRILKALKG